MEDERIERWSTAFRQFGELECRGLSDLYERLALGVSDDVELLRWFADASGPRTNANQLFAAVHYLLLRGTTHRLSQFYPTLTPTPLPSRDAYPAFHDFCLEHENDLAAVIRQRTTQTNEVSRCTYLLPALVTAGVVSTEPLFLIDVGTASGMNLLFDRYHYDYGDGPTCGAEDSPVRLRTELHGKLPPVAPLPSIAGRVGIDLNPIDANDAEATGWLRACVWPEHVERFRNLESALAVVREVRPNIVRGNAVDLLPTIVTGAEAGTTVVVVHTNVLPYFSPGERSRWRDVLEEIGKSRNLIWLAAEADSLLAAVGFRGLDPKRAASRTALPLAMVSFIDSERRDRVLALTGAHGRWLEWF